MSRHTVIDPWSYFDYKESFGSRGGGNHPFTAPMWIGTENHRRLSAYKMLESYYRNSARDWLGPQADEEDRLSRREYGDPATIVDQTLSSLLGEDQSIVVPEANTEDNPDADDQLQKLLEWADNEMFFLKMYETELSSCKLGDGVYVLGWNEELGRPRLHVYDPGFYFPVLGEEGGDTFPNKVHIAYEYLDDNDDHWVRRITWEIVETEEGDLRSYPWNDKPVNKTVLMSDMEWKLENLQSGTSIYSFTAANATIRMDEEDLEIDFIPVVHIPCSVSIQEHFGTSVLAKVMQIFDDLVSTDTDLQAASSTTGTPPIALSGAGAPKDSRGNILSYGPGTVFETGDGTATVIDTSKSLDALLGYKKDLLERLSINSKIPESLLGRVKPNEVPSGIAITLSFTPHTFLIRQMRRVRLNKYGLLFKMVSRFFQRNGDIDQVFPANLEFGSFLPSDMQETATLVQELLTAHAISTDTAVLMLVNAGFPIESALEEVARINAENFDAANKMLEATGDVAAVREYLGLEALPAELTSPPPPAPAPTPPTPTPPNP